MTEITRAQFAIAALIVVALAWWGARAIGLSEPAQDGVSSPASKTVARGEPGSGDPSRLATARAGSGVAGAGAVVVRGPERRVVVHVAGAVRRPGVYRLTDGQRIADAVRRAGGGARGADLDAINLAAKARDGVQIIVPRRAPGGVSGAGLPAGAASAAGGTTSAAAAAGGTAGTGTAAAGSIIDLNTATAEQLETLDGVGPATSAKILQHRVANGPFRSVDDLDLIPGIGPKKLAAIRPRVRV